MLSELRRALLLPKRRISIPYTRNPNSLRSLSRPAAIYLTTARPFYTSPRWRSEDTPIPEPSRETLGAYPALDLLPQGALPVCCPGCGAFSQTELREKAGHYNLARQAVQRYVNRHKEDAVYQAALRSADPETMKEMRNADNMPSKEEAVFLSPTSKEIPFCDRCHKIIHHSSAESIEHPPLSAIEATISESPHKSNHIWHIIDAADFPMSLILDIDKRLSLAHIRTKNRRSRNKKYISGSLVEMSFIVTRADLLAPREYQVDKLVPKLREIMRNLLRKHSKANIRLGNLHVVSADRGWHTKTVKSKLLKSPGGNWLVGKVNVGKSRLFETIFPKGTNDRSIYKQIVPPVVPDCNASEHSDAAKLGAQDHEQLKEYDGKGEVAERAIESSERVKVDSLSTKDIEGTSAERNPIETLEELERLEDDEGADDFNESFSLLPPVQALQQYPVMPVISDLPGTTASPIRVPFQNGRGELIDLPGLARGNIQDYVYPEHRSSLIMKSRVSPERIVLKPGRALILGGLIHIKPLTDDVIIMAHCFMPIKPHLTSHRKAEAIIRGEIESGVATLIANADAQSKIESAGTFKLTDDVTRIYAGPLTRNDAVGFKPEQLPFVIYATDILIEGVGWIELVAQLRRPKTFARKQEQAEDDLKKLDLEWQPQEPQQDPRLPPFPEVEIFSPEGRFIGQRPCIGGFALGGPLKKKIGARPRRSMKSVKNQRQKMVRTSESAD